MDEKEVGNYWIDRLKQIIDETFQDMKGEPPEPELISSSTPCPNDDPDNWQQCKDCPENEKCILSEGNVIPIRTVKHLRLVVNKPLFSERKSIIYLSKVK